MKPIFNIEAARELINTYRSLELNNLNKLHEELCKDDPEITIRPVQVLKTLTGFGSMSSCALCKEVRYALKEHKWDRELLIDLFSSAICNYCIWSYPDRKEQFHIPCMYDLDGNGLIRSSTYISIHDSENIEEMLEVLNMRADMIEELINRYEKDINNGERL